MSLQETILLTGFPGFIGRRLVKKILDNSGSEIILLVQKQMEPFSRKLLEEMDPKGERTRIWVGDISKPDLGLNPQDFLYLSEKVQRIFHLAALYNLGAKFHISHQVNVLGTRHILSLAQRSKNLKRLDYFSTAYVAGRRKGLVKEEELECRQRFRNNYEITKFFAEMEVRRHLQKIPTTIYRPAIVVGDSRTGAIDKFDGPYYAIRLLNELEKKKQMFLAPFLIPNIGTAEAGLNIVPVDFIVDSVFALSQDQEAEGKTFHLVDPAPMKVREFRDYIFDKFQAKPLPIALPKGILHFFEWIPSAIWMKLVGIPLPTLYYLNDTPQYDTSQASSFLKRLGILCPRALSYMDRMIDFVRNQKKEVFMVSTPEGLKPLS